LGFAVTFPPNRLYLASLLLSLAPHVAIAATELQVSSFIAAAKTHAKTDEALAALQAGPEDEFYRWGEETCTWLRLGKSNVTNTEANLAEFFGPDLASALVFAALNVICPEFSPKCQPLHLN
jgi:hypothetical protein